MSSFLGPPHLSCVLTYQILNGIRLNPYCRLTKKALAELMTGAPWRDLPERYGPRTTVYNRYARWAQRGVWQGIFEALATSHKDSLFFIDSSIVKAHRAASGAKGGSWRRVSAAHAEAARVKFTL